MMADDANNAQRIMHSGKKRRNGIRFHRKIPAKHDIMCRALVSNY